MRTHAADYIRTDQWTPNQSLPWMAIILVLPFFFSSWAWTRRKQDRASPTRLGFIHISNPGSSATSLWLFQLFSCLQFSILLIWIAIWKSSKPQLEVCQLWHSNWWRKRKGSIEEQNTLKVGKKRLCRWWEWGWFSRSWHCVHRLGFLWDRLHSVVRHHLFQKCWQHLTHSKLQASLIFLPEDPFPRVLLDALAIANRWSRGSETTEDPGYSQLMRALGHRREVSSPLLSLILIRFGSVSVISMVWNPQNRKKITLAKHGMIGKLPNELGKRI